MVCTGGEPLLQLDEAAVEAFHAAGFEVAVETNGTQAAPPGLDWVCVSPKAGAPLRLTSGDELKLVYPQEGAGPEMFEDLEFPAAAAAADGRPGTGQEHPAGRGVLPGPPAVAAEPADPQVPGDRVMEIFREFTFEAAHRLTHVPDGHKCARLHGHSYRVEIHVAGPVGEQTGWVMDFQEIKDAFAPLHDQLDHRYLNEVDGLDNPTSENLARWIWDRLTGALPLSRWWSGRPAPRDASTGARRPDAGGRPGRRDRPAPAGR